jgi:SulP family sulfate permease
METSGVEVIEREIKDEFAELGHKTVRPAMPEGVDMFEVNEPFIFGVANRFEETERNISRTPEVRIVRLWHVPFMEATETNNLRNFIKMFQGQNVVVLLSGPNA